MGWFEEMALLVFEGMVKLGMVLKDLAKVRVVDLACLVLIPPGGTGVAGFSTKWVGVYGCKLLVIAKWACRCLGASTRAPALV